MSIHNYNLKGPILRCNSKGVLWDARGRATTWGLEKSGRVTFELSLEDD